MPLRLLGLMNFILYVCMYTSNDRIRNNELKRMWKESRLNLRYYPRIHMKGVRKPTRQAISVPRFKLGTTGYGAPNHKIQPINNTHITHEKVKTILPSIALSSYCMTLACI